MVQFAEENSKHKAAKVFKVHRGMVRKWCKQKDFLKELPHGAKCLKGRGRKVYYQDIEDRLLNWMNVRREKGGRVTGKALKKECLRLHRLYGNQSFKASQGWYQNFKKRHNTVMRRTTHISQNPKEITDDLISSFQRQIIRLRLTREFQLSDIGNINETPVWLEMPGNYTLDNTGKKEITASTTSHHKERVTVILAGLADGTELKPWYYYLESDLLNLMISLQA